MPDTFYLTTPIYYVNDLPHLGHAYTTVVSDVICRWHRLHGRDVHFLTGTDEHGDKNARVAAEKGMTPQAYVDDIVVGWRELWQRLSISNDDFIRTTEERHGRQVVPFMERVKASDDVYLADYEGWYCVGCEEFKTDTELVDGNCPQHAAPVEWLKEENYFFRLSKYNDALIELYERDPGFLRPDRAYNEMYARLKEGLRDIPISRPSVTWGVPVPWDEGHVIYIWIEALQNYLTAIGFSDDPERFARWWPVDVHMMGKEIVWQHAVVWPALLMSAGVPLPKRVFAHGHLMAGGERISKSGRGITKISPHELADEFGVDGYRFHFVRSVSFGDDGNFSLEDMQARYNAELANDFGNLASRTLSMIDRYFDGVIPLAGAEGEAETAVRDLIRTAGGAADDAMRELRVTDALSEVWEVVRHANRYLVEREPWKLARDDANRELVGTVLHVTAFTLASLAGLLSPVLVGACAELWTRLGLDGEPSLEVPDLTGRTVTIGEALFPRIDD